MTRMWALVWSARPSAATAAAPQLPALRSAPSGSRARPRGSAGHQEHEYRPRGQPSRVQPCSMQQDIPWPDIPQGGIGPRYDRACPEGQRYIVFVAAGVHTAPVLFSLSAHTDGHVWLPADIP